MSRSWIAVACAEHVRRGQAGGFMQVCHGKAGPLRRLSPGDSVIYYSPTTLFRQRDGLQAFTAIGHVADRAPYQAMMDNGFEPFRRDVVWQRAETASIHPLLPVLDFSAGNRNWGYSFRLGLFEIANGDRDRIAEAMRAVPA